MNESNKIIESLNKYRNTKKDNKSLEKFFQVYSGGYGEGDKFIGVSVPNQRKVMEQFYKETSLDDIQNLLNSEIHEHRLTSLYILVKKYQKSKKAEEREAMALLYLNNIDRVNGWDLVDSSAQHIVGPYVLETSKFDILDNLAESNHLWKQRVSIIATFYLIRQGHYMHTLRISEKLVNHKHDLIHKAVGWMLREIGNRSLKDELPFLDKYAQIMPRTMLRYAIEKFDPELRDKYLTMGQKRK
ncbi:MAG: DNA alkylation repair protein [Bacteroidales bacterium]|nr:DNA alkylation repair protein [Bacteroidales bacterium]